MTNFRNLMQTAKHVLFAIPVAITVNDSVVSTACIEGGSMQPVLNPKGSTTRDRVLLDKFTIRMARYKRGDVCLLKSPDKPNSWIVKRLIALEGDKVKTDSQGIVPVPQGFCWIEGDNEDNSIDSKQLGPVPLALIHGRVTHVFWPLNRVGKVQRVFPKERVLIGYHHPWP
ncbi:hypothetical protein GUITHDRAFT_86641 [Guillardia theta CCMP2712]|uniref:Mitochondrial inner membrane protease subunit n=1 Tax=Guillardia theta (strain CCMP2712) TaxID=905079 RepID=L1JF33_GUITC|nr:hypothetical protein GUITHDRAFT_86641 [Guillardia theta CCMP2712]EKX46705.1 hypothetical protein GUITHDRAFT_86641 [Guillardia theta CCMP2712]|mmetsp:Transcript_22619/g.74083  ORF Transcript_22619/g.74083 Transcript_22619/m.74083 type:complete len:171 (-) Transcript_22619:95-607(-)|eukprot:XP_005833685.1 hypothetical protein GUITHDRAFT_86641 [Guillardia theta CCMP2712]